MEDRWRRCWLAGWGGGGRLGGAEQTTETTHLDLADLTGARPAGRQGRWLVVEVPAQHSASAILLDLLHPTPVLGGSAPAGHHLLVRRHSSSTSSCCCSPLLARAGDAAAPYGGHGGAWNRGGEAA
jgi:hypothetical protein